jgi:hypothetical protein
MEHGKKTLAHLVVLDAVARRHEESEIGPRGAAMEEEHVPSTVELDEHRRAPVARWMLGWLADHERAKDGGAGASDASARLSSRGIEIIAGLLRLQVCRGEPAAKLAHALAGELAQLAETYERCATLPEAAERELDALRGVTFRTLAAMLDGAPTTTEPGAARRN